MTLELLAKTWMDKVVPFGKYKGHKIGDVYEYDPLYLGWAVTNDVEWFCMHLPKKKIKTLKKAFKQDRRDRQEEYENAYYDGQAYGGRRTKEDYDESDYEIGGYDLAVDWYK